MSHDIDPVAWGSYDKVIIVDMIQAIKGALGYIEANSKSGATEAEPNSLKNVQVASLKWIIGSWGVSVSLKLQVRPRTPCP